jgi:hypothetical protein
MNDFSNATKDGVVIVAGGVPRTYQEIIAGLKAENEKLKTQIQDQLKRSTAQIIYYRDMWKAQMAENQKERERCAKIAEDWIWDGHLELLAETIRSPKKGNT